MVVYPGAAECGSQEDALRFASDWEQGGRPARELIMRALMATGAVTDPACLIEIIASGVAPESTQLWSIYMRVAGMPKSPLAWLAAVSPVRNCEFASNICEIGRSLCIRARNQPAAYARAFITWYIYSNTESYDLLVDLIHAVHVLVHVSPDDLWPCFDELIRYPWQKSVLGALRLFYERETASYTACDLSLVAINALLVLFFYRDTPMMPAPLPIRADNDTFVAVAVSYHLLPPVSPDIIKDDYLDALIQSALRSNGVDLSNPMMIIRDSAGPVLDIGRYQTNEAVRLTDFDEIPVASAYDREVYLAPCRMRNPPNHIDFTTTRFELVPPEWRGPNNVIHMYGQLASAANQPVPLFLRCGDDIYTRQDVLPARVAVRTEIPSSLTAPARHLLIFLRSGFGDECMPIRLTESPVGDAQMYLQPSARLYIHPAPSEAERSAAYEWARAILGQPYYDQIIHDCESDDVPPSMMCEEDNVSN